MGVPLFILTVEGMFMKMKMKIKVITDSTADISPALLEKYDITAAPLDVIMDGVPHLATEVTNEAFYAHLADCLRCGRRLPTTSQVTPYRFEELLRPYAGAEDTFVIVAPIAKEMSNTYFSAKSAIDTLGMKNAYLLDTHITTFGLGALVLEIAKLAENTSLSLEEFIARAEDLNRRVWIYVSIGDLRCLRAGGRLTAASMALGSLLRVKPIVCIDKKVDVCAKVLGQAKAAKTIAERVAAERDPALPLTFGDTISPEITEPYKTKYAELLSVTGEEACLTMGPVVGTHAGPSCGGIAFFKKPELV